MLWGRFKIPTTFSTPSLQTRSRGSGGPGTEIGGALDVGGGGQLLSVSCSASGGCAAGGFYKDASASQQPLVADRSGGSWNAGVELPGSINNGTFSSVNSVSCPTAGNCAAVGVTTNNSLRQAFVDSEVSGTWQNGTVVGQNLNTQHNATLYSVRCWSVGNCSAVGFYSFLFSPTSIGTKGLGAEESNGHWGAGFALAAGLLAKTTWASYDELNALSCSPSGSCTAVGNIGDAFQADVFGALRNP